MEGLKDTNRWSRQREDCAGMKETRWECSCGLATKRWSYVHTITPTLPSSDILALSAKCRTRALVKTMSLNEHVCAQKTYNWGRKRPAGMMRRARALLLGQSARGSKRGNNQRTASPKRALIGVRIATPGRLVNRKRFSRNSCMFFFN